MKKILIGCCLIFIWSAFVMYDGPVQRKKLKLKAETSLAKVQESLGMDFDHKTAKKYNGANARIGEDIVKHGFSNRDGQKRSKRQSKHFVCTSCHNIKREDPDLAHPTPEARLAYTAERGMPFLQATTLYGVVNRDTYYNGDYEKKYEELVEPARHDIREAIQLCATQCAQGRALKDWEMESVLAYLWEIGLKLKDLDLSDMELESLQAAVDNPALQAEGLKLLNRKYKKESDATFLLPPADRKVGTALEGDPKNGKLIYNNSCLHCHYQKRYSFLPLDHSKMSLGHLDRAADGYGAHSVYQVVRWGTYSKFMKKSYMPNYTAERMSEQQLADLRAYLATGPVLEKVEGE